MTAASPGSRGCPIRDLRVSVYRVPTDGPESDGTLEWASTTMVFVEIDAGSRTGIGYTYADRATATLVWDVLRDAVMGRDALETGALWTRMMASVRNLGRAGVSAMAISAVDVALWDLRGKLLDAPVCHLLGAVRRYVPVYGSGGFTSYTPDRLCEQLAGWVSAAIPRVKMKVGRAPGQDPDRVARVRKAVGPDAEIFVDANGAYHRKQAVALAHAFAASGVTWFEEPVDHEDFAGLAAVRSATPPGLEVTSGEYGYTLDHFRRLVEAESVDVLQADATRCGGFTGLLAVDGLAQAWRLPLSTHCAPYLHLHAAMACKQLRHSEYFYDHVRIARLFFDGVTEPCAGALAVRDDLPGIGLVLKKADAEPYAG
jgi:L-alanine-DL-glutamate epimerase-like enolase superfamily enzyme